MKKPIQMSVAELQAYLRSNNIEYPKDAKRGALIALAAKVEPATPIYVPQVKEGIEPRKSVPANPELKSRLLGLAQWTEDEARKSTGSGSSRMRYIAKQLRVLVMRV